MKPAETGRAYDRISAWWEEQIQQSTAGIPFVRRAMQLCGHSPKALDVGCGSGGRIIQALLEGGFNVTGIDVSKTLLENAKRRHPASTFICDDICEWQPREKYNLILAWDSIFHVPHSQQSNVVEKLCDALAHGGVLLFTAGGVDGEITGEMCGEEFYYSSLDQENYLEIIKNHGCTCILLERDQYPEKHVVFMAVKDNN